eukprot:CCRYP_003808-RA/>CCRYP_003808-RA protein AED:0.01 eAED:0.01 QI:182/1/1/1/0/0.5/2/505/546
MDRPDISPVSNERIAESASLFQHVLPPHRFGIRYTSLESYFEAVGNADVPTEFSLVVLLSSNSHYEKTNDNCSNISILLGKKLRGFGKGFFNCFGGKLETSLDEHKHPARGAVREVKEETGINIPLSAMEEGFIGTLNFTFADSDVNRAMKVHLYCVILSLSVRENVKDGTHTATHTEKSTKLIIHPDEIRGCDEIDPIWFNNVYDIPLHEMFADDSLWLVMLLKHYDDILKPENEGQLQLESSPVNEHLSQRKLMFDAWFHFQSGGAETNQILHHFIKVNESKSPGDPKFSASKYTLEKQLFHALHLNHIHSPSIKEFKENWAMANAVRRYMGEERMEYVIDVAGGHGALAALFLVLVRKCHTAIVIDPAVVSGKEGIRQVWSPFWTTLKCDKSQSKVKTLRYRHECLRTGLRKELETILFDIENPPSPTSVLVTACHACQHLTDETMQIAAEYGVNVGKIIFTRVQCHNKWYNISLTIYLTTQYLSSLHAMLPEGPRRVVEANSETDETLDRSYDRSLNCWEDVGMGNRVHSRNKVSGQNEVNR